MIKGLFNPSSSRNASIVSGGAFGVAMRTAMSPGITASKKNSRVCTKKISGINHNSLFSTYFFIPMVDPASTVRKKEKRREKTTQF